MGAPKHPDTIIIKNKYYPNGMNQQKIWDYYQSNKMKIIKACSGSPVILFIYLDGGIMIVKRRTKLGPILLTKDNYNNILHGRVVSLSMEIKSPTNYWCIDIDRPKNIKMQNIKECVNDIINFYKEDKLVKNYKVFLSANSFHVYGYLNFPIDIDTARRVLEKKLMYKFTKYAINKKGTNLINLDFSPMYPMGSHPVPYALSRNGLIYMDVTKNWKTVKHSDAIVG